MTAYRLLALTAASGMLAFAAPAVAHPEMRYEYGETVAEGEVVFSGGPVVQPLPAPPPMAGHVVQDEHRDVVIAQRAPDAYPVPPLPHHGYPPPAYPMGYRPEPPFDRGAWLADCRERIRGVRPDERGAVIGGLLGAGVGGVIGNRAWDSERLAGTLLGAGVGGLAGLAVGSAIDAAGDRNRADECAWHLDRHMTGGYRGHAYGYPGYGYGYQGYGYPAVAYVPVLVAVPQRAVVRETVTEEWIDSPAPAQAVTPTKIIRQSAPVGDKRIKYTKVR